MTDDKAQLLGKLKQEFKDWEDLLSGLSEGQITSLSQPSGLTIKNQIAHLWAWQQLSIARLEAANEDREPIPPDWPADLDPDAEDVDELNAWFYETSRQKPWASVYGDWRSGFMRFIELAEAIPEENFFDAEKYPWLNGYPLSGVLIGSYEHHHIDHLEPLRDWLREQKLTKD